MTEAQAAWLRKLRDEGPQKRAPRGTASAEMYGFGFTEWTKARGWEINEYGAAMLAAHERKEPQP